MSSAKCSPRLYIVFWCSFSLNNSGVCIAAHPWNWAFLGILTEMAISNFVILQLIDPAFGFWSPHFLESCGPESWQIINGNHASLSAFHLRYWVWAWLILVEPLWSSTQTYEVNFQYMISKSDIPKSSKIDLPRCTRPFWPWKLRLAQRSTPPRPGRKHW